MVEIVTLSTLIYNICQFNICLCNICLCNKFMKSNKKKMVETIKIKNYYDNIITIGYKKDIIKVAQDAPLLDFRYYSLLEGEIEDGY